MIACLKPRCPECSKPAYITEPFLDGVWQQERCSGCGVYAQYKRFADGDHDAWLARTATEAKGYRTAPLPAVATSTLKARFFDACRSMARRLQPCEGVEPGMSTLEAGRHE